MQDNVDVYLSVENVVSNDKSELLASRIQIRNISTLPLTIEKYRFNGVKREISPYRLPSTTQFPDAFYYINLPAVGNSDYVRISYS